MKYITTVLSLFLLASCDHSDNVCMTKLHDSDVAIKHFDTTVIWLGCGEGGEISPQFISQFNFTDTKNFDSIKKNLASNDKLNKIISVVILEELNKKKTVDITESEKLMMDEIKQLQSYYYICQGCTGHYYDKISDLFENKNSGHFREFIKWNIFKLKPWDK